MIRLLIRLDVALMPVTSRPICNTSFLTLRYWDATGAFSLKRIIRMSLSYYVLHRKDPKDPGQQATKDLLKLGRSEANHISLAPLRAPLRSTPDSGRRGGHETSFGQAFAYRLGRD